MAELAESIMNRGVMTRYDVAIHVVQTDEQDIVEMAV